MKYEIILKDKKYEIEVEKGDARVMSVAAVAAVPAPVSTPVPVAPVTASAPVTVGGGEPISCPMPGTILDIKVSAGQSVKKGDILLVLEAMKMENEITSPSDAVVKQVVVNKGASVNTGDTLIVLG